MDSILRRKWSSRRRGRSDGRLRGLPWRRASFMVLEPRLALDAAADAMPVIHVTTLMDELDPNDGLTSLREAVAIANASPGSKIVLDCPGTYRLRVSDPAPGDGTADIDITASMTICPSHPTFFRPFVIDGNGLDRIFDIHGAVDVVIKDLTLRNGSALGNGGAIAAADPGADLALIGDKFLCNRASGSGGAVFMGVETYLTVDGCSFERNRAGENGGAIGSIGFSVIVSRSTFFRNQACGMGGAVFLASQAVDTLDPLSICGSKFLGNRASGSGGAVFSGALNVLPAGIDGGTVIDGEATVAIDRSCFATNSSGGNGGAVAVEPLLFFRDGADSVESSIATAAVVDIDDCKFVANSSALDGGGVSIELPRIFDGTFPVDSQAAVDSQPVADSAVQVTDSCFLVNRAGGNGGGLNVAVWPTYTTTVVSADDVPSDGETPFILIEADRFFGNCAAGNGGGVNVELTPPLTPAKEEGDAATIQPLVPTAVAVVDSAFLANTAGGDGGGMNVGAFFAEWLENDASKQIPTTGGVVVVCSRFVGNTAARAGGGLWVENVPSLTVEHSEFRCNRSAVDGGGLGYEVSFLPSADFTLKDSCVTDNVVTGAATAIGTYGGGVSFDFSSFNTSGLVTVDICRTEISCNSVGGSGGGLFLRDQAPGVLFNVNLFQLCVTGNSATGNAGITFGGNGSGGGIAIDTVASGTILLDQSTIAKNRATNVGGGVYLSQPTGTTAFSNSTFSCNSAVVNGGGIFVAAAAPNSLTMTNDTVSGNTTSGNGGGIYVDTGALANLINVTIARNQAGLQGGGIFNNGGTVNVLNTIIALNTVPGPATDGPDAFGTFVDQGFNLIGVVEGSTGFNVSALVGTSGAPLDPRLGELKDNGGPTKTIALLCDSPAIDAGTTGTDVPTTDQRGAARDGAPDIGAYERTSGQAPS